jgi:hypothetical protein
MKVAAFFQVLPMNYLRCERFATSDVEGQVRIAEASIFITNNSQLFITSNVN